MSLFWSAVLLGPDTPLLAAECAVGRNRDRARPAYSSKIALALANHGVAGVYEVESQVVKLSAGAAKRTRIGIEYRLVERYCECWSKDDIATFVTDREGQYGLKSVREYFLFTGAGQIALERSMREVVGEVGQRARRVGEFFRCLLRATIILPSVQFPEDRLSLRHLLLRLLPLHRFNGRIGNRSPPSPDQNVACT